MTTGRINQVAFLSDVDAEFARRATTESTIVRIRFRSDTQEAAETPCPHNILHPRDPMGARAPWQRHNQVRPARGTRPPSCPSRTRWRAQEGNIYPGTTSSVSLGRQHKNRAELKERSALAANSDGATSQQFDAQARSLPTHAALPPLTRIAYSMTHPQQVAGRPISTKANRACLPPNWSRGSTAKHEERNRWSNPRPHRATAWCCMPRHRSIPRTDAHSDPAEFAAQARFGETPTRVQVSFLPRFEQRPRKSPNKHP